ncbi:MAG: flagellar basal body P-ring protein FlgI [Planctomycetia bacterium]|nr:MAG: flagellar basal body P-ring protein FlgI [Planctomycetia bacterium]
MSHPAEDSVHRPARWPADWPILLGTLPRLGPGRLAAAILTLVAAWAGCTGPVLRPPGPDDIELLDPEVQLIGDLAHPYGMNYVKLEGISLVTNLDGTGGDPSPSPRRATLLAEMQRRSVSRPASLLASPDTALVLVRGYLRPGTQKGDQLDVEVRVPSHSDTVSLRGGWLLETQLTEIAVLGHQLHTGHRLATAEGPVLIDPATESDRDRPLRTRGRVLRGGTVLKSRMLGLAIDTRFQSIETSRKIGRAVNKRFHTYIRGIKRGVATPKTDKFVELVVHPRYKDNVGRFMRLVRSIAYEETPLLHQQRMRLLEKQLQDPITCTRAALRFEAIGDEAIETLKRTVAQAGQDPDVRFCAAEALAYLDQTDAVEALAEAIHREPRVRLRALAALSFMDDAVAYDALRDLLDADSAETCYGAFRALSTMPPRDAALSGETLGGQFLFCVLDVKGAPMVHVTRSFRPELVLFGKDQHFQLPLILDAGRHIMIKGDEQSGTVVVSRFVPGEADQRRQVSDRVEDVVRAIVELGGTYPDVVQALQQAKESGALGSRFKVDALPDSEPVGGRSAGDWPATEAAPLGLGNPWPDWLFRDRG